MRWESAFNLKIRGGETAAPSFERPSGRLGSVVERMAWWHAEDQAARLSSARNSVSAFADGYEPVPDVIRGVMPDYHALSIAAARILAL